MAVYKIVIFCLFHDSDRKKLSSYELKCYVSHMKTHQWSSTAVGGWVLIRSIDWSFLGSAPSGPAYSALSPCGTFDDAARPSPPVIRRLRVPTISLLTPGRSVAPNKNYHRIQGIVDDCWKSLLVGWNDWDRRGSHRMKIRKEKDTKQGSTANNK